MDKQIAKALREIAETLPLVFEWEHETIYMSGEDLNLTPFGEKMKFEKDKMYPLEMPLLRAVEHKQQLKDAFKRGKMPAVYDYIKRLAA